jgi:23S rRNA pseudouridine1911/1915/1917 synthase
MTSFMTAIEVKVEGTERIDVALLRAIKQQHPLISRARLKKFFENDLILFKDRPLQNSRQLGPCLIEIEILNFNELIETEPLPATALPDSSSSHSQPSLSPPLTILFENSDLLALDKPTRMDSIPHTAQERTSALNHALALRPELAKVKTKNPLEPSILHRLDSGTSGVILFAKTTASYLALKNAWHDPQQVKKTYRALCTQNLPHSHSIQSQALDLKPGMLLTPSLIHDPKNRKKMKLAQTYQLESALKTWTQILNLQNRHHLCDFTLEIRTGVMHQIRCTLASYGYPILGDLLYKGIPASRLMLHAWKVHLNIPAATSGLQESLNIEIQSELPSSFKN